MHVLKNKLNLANMHNMKIADYEKCATDSKYAKSKQNITKKIYQTTLTELNSICDHWISNVRRLRNISY